MLRPATALLAAAVLAATLHAHGGMYRGPGSTTPGPGTPLGGPTYPGVPGPTTGARPQAGSSSSWIAWWEVNKEPYVRVRSQLARGPVTGSDEFYLGPRRHQAGSDVLLASALDRRLRIVPALLQLLASERNRDVATAATVALAKAARDLRDPKVMEAIRAQLQRDDQEVRETAALALGILADPAAIGDLASLLQDTKQGRALVADDRVSVRTRAFAAYALGFLGGRSAPAAGTRVLEALVPVLESDLPGSERELRVAVVHGIGLLRCIADDAATKRLRWQALQALWRYESRDLGAGEELAQAHVATAVARLLGRGDSADHQHAKRRFAAQLDLVKRATADRRQGAALALGSTCLPAELSELDAPYLDLLARSAADAPDIQTRCFATIALARIGGSAARAKLLELHATARATTSKPWTSLALGLCVRPAALRGTPDAEVGRLLLDDILGTQDDELRSALAVALGLSGWREAAPHLMALLREHEERDQLAGYLCVGLALLKEEAALDDFTRILRGAVRKPYLLQQAAAALGTMGDRDVVPVLVDVFAQRDDAASLAAVAGALSLVGDRRSIDPLLGRMQDAEQTKLARAFAAGALGGVGDPDSVPWNVRLLLDVNYTTGTDTLTNGQSGVLDIL